MHLVVFAAVILPVALLRFGHLKPGCVFALSISRLIELVQPLVAREASWLDMAANGLGVALGSALGLAVLALRRHRDSG